MAMDFDRQGPPRIFLDYTDPKFDPVSRRRQALDESRSSLSNFIQGIQSGTVIGAGLLGALAYKGAQRRRNQRHR